MSQNDMRRLFDAVLTEPRPDTTDLDAAIRGGRRRRQRRTAAVLLSCAAVVAVGAVALSGALSGSQGPVTPPAAGGTPFPVPTSQWKPGDAGMTALLEGTLVKDGSGCLVVDDLVIVWPAGYTAQQTPAGSVEVIDPDGRVVARTGAPLRAGGGSSPVGVSGPCISGRPAAELFHVNDELPALDVAEDQDLPHASPTDSTPPPQAYYDSYVGMGSAAAAERAEADGWLPRVINPGEGMDLAYGYNRLTLQIGDDGTVDKASRG
jgi:hypothetical protein